MKQLLFLLALVFITNAGAQTKAVALQQGKYINKTWKYSKPVVTDIPVLFDYPRVIVGDSTYRLTDNIGDTSTAMYDLYVSHCINNKRTVGILAVSIYKDGSYYLSITYGNLIRRYTLKYDVYEMGNN